MTTTHPELEGLGRYEFGWADPDIAGATAKRGLSAKAAGDAVSRCKRLESILGMPLERTVSSQGRFENALERLWQKHPRRNDLLYSLRLYASFHNPRIKPKKYIFYGDVSRLREQQT